MTSTAPIGGGSGNVPSSSINGDTTATTTATTLSAQQVSSGTAASFHQHEQQQPNAFAATAGLISSEVVGSSATAGMMKGPADNINPNTTANRESNNNDTNNNNNNKRLSKTTAYLPFVYGSIAFYLGKKADEFQTHEWTLYVRGPNQEDLSLAISKVVFQLHASFAKPIRELSTPPFEVTERGWGEFEAQIRIVWKDPEEKPTVVRMQHCCCCFLLLFGWLVLCFVVLKK